MTGFLAFIFAIFATVIIMKLDQIHERLKSIERKSRRTYR